MSTIYEAQAPEVQRVVDAQALEYVKAGALPETVRFRARRARADLEHRWADSQDLIEDRIVGAGLPPYREEHTRRMIADYGQELGRNFEAALIERFEQFRKAGGAPWTIYPCGETGERLALALFGVPEEEQDATIEAFLAPVVADLTGRGFAEGEARAWAEAIAGEAGMREVDFKFAGVYQTGQA